MDLPWNTAIPEVGNGGGWTFHDVQTGGERNDSESGLRLAQGIFPFDLVV